MRFIIPAGYACYVFLDFPKNDGIRKAGIPLRKDKHGNRYTSDEDVIEFVRKELGREDLQFMDGLY